MCLPVKAEKLLSHTIRYTPDRSAVKLPDNGGPFTFFGGVTNCTVLNSGVRTSSSALLRPRSIRPSKRRADTSSIILTLVPSAGFTSTGDVLAEFPLAESSDVLRLNLQNKLSRNRAQKSTSHPQPTENLQTSVHPLSILKSIKNCLHLGIYTVWLSNGCKIKSTALRVLLSFCALSAPPTDSHIKSSMDLLRTISPSLRQNFSRSSTCSAEGTPQSSPTRSVSGAGPVCSVCEHLLIISAVFDRVSGSLIVRDDKSTSIASRDLRICTLSSLLLLLSVNAKSILYT
mmetsp:Transcript_24395/g.35833  ORF Transcript_24395/g.35833 Transcript_24395/m.35833 type:complete len:287 (+) Transcript_24395:2377-3237(+)